MAKKITATIVIMVVFLTSLKVGHETRRISVRTSCRNCEVRVKNPARAPCTPRSRRTARPSGPSPNRAARGSGKLPGTSEELTRSGGASGNGNSSESSLSLMTLSVFLLFDTRPLTFFPNLSDYRQVSLPLAKTWITITTQAIPSSTRCKYRLGAKSFTFSAPRGSVRAYSFPQSAYCTAAGTMRAITLNVRESNIINIPEKS